MYELTLGYVVLFGLVRDGRHQRRNVPHEEALHRRGVTLLDSQLLVHRPPLPRVYDLSQQNLSRPILGGL